MRKLLLISVLALAATLQASGATAGVIVRDEVKPIPGGHVIVKFSNGMEFQGDVEGQWGDGSGTIRYANGDVFAGGFVDGRPSGLCALTLASGATYLFNFRDGRPVEVYKARSIEPVHASTIEVYKAQEVEPYKAGTIDPAQSQQVAAFEAAILDLHRAQGIEPVQAQEAALNESQVLKQYEARPVEKAQTSLGVARFEAQVADRLAPAPSVTASTGSTSDLSSGPDYSNPVVQMWTAQMNALPYLIYGGMTY